MSRPKLSPVPAKLADIAAATGLSLSTVSRVLNRRKLHERLSRKTTERVHAAARRLGYLPHHGAQALATNRSLVIGAAVPPNPVGRKEESSPLGDEYLGKLLGHAEVFFRARGFDLLLLNAADSKSLCARSAAKFRARQIDGVLLAGNTSALTLRTLELEGVPAVAVDYAGPLAAGSHVGLDNRGAIAVGLDHLQSLGHRRIAFLGRHGRTVYADIAVRRRAFREEMARRGLASGSSSFADWPAPEIQGSQESGAWAADQIAALPLRRRPTAILTVDDVQAFAVVQRLREHGLFCPLDVSVVGFDDSSPARLSSPALTTIDHGLQVIAERAGAVLLECIEHRREGKVFPPVREKIPARLIRRESTARAIR